MNLQFIGAAGTVTGSKYLLAADGKKYLIDCGLFQGLKVLRLRNWAPPPFNPREIEAVILTHAHIDHSGYLPLLVKNGFRGKIYATPATMALCRILLPDAGHLQEEDAAFANQHSFSKHHPALPLYTEQDAWACLDQFHTVAWETKQKISPKLSFSLYPAGHILGASIVRVEVENVKVTFSGDLGRPHSPLMNAPAAAPETDYLILESTYGDRKHPKENPETTLQNLINRTLNRGGTVLIPAFAVGRAQEMLYLISRLKKSGRIPNVPVYLNSPMSAQATHVFQDFLGSHALSAQECREMTEAVTVVATPEESKRLNMLHSSAIILSASGMATGGRVLHHLKSLAPNPKNLILFAGFQAMGTRGETILGGAGSVKIHGEMIPIRAEVQSLDTLSAHADADEILSWLRNFSIPPKMTFITHGEPLASEALRKRIQQERHWPCKVPDYLESCELM